MNSLSWHLAWRYLRRHPRRKRFAFSTVVSVAGVALGVAALLIVMGVLGGLEEFIRESVITVDAPLSILPVEGRSVQLPDSVLARLLELPSVQSVSPFIQGEAVIRQPSRGVDAGCRIRGIDLGDRFVLQGMTEKLSYGEMPSFDQGDEQGVVMGIYLAEQFYHAVGDTLYLFPPRAFFSSRGHGIGTALLTGAVETGLPINDETLAFVSLELAAAMFLPEGGVSGYNVHPAASASDEDVARDMEELLPGSAVLRTWKELNPDLTASMKLERMGAFLALLLITLVATFNIMGTIARSAIERRSDISLLKAIGSPDRLIFRVFLWEGVLVGVAGVAAGLVLGLAGCWVIGSTNLLQLPDVYSFHENIPVSLSITEISLVTIIAFMLSLSSGIIPALRASRLDPVRGLTA